MCRGGDYDIYLQVDYYSSSVYTSRDKRNTIHTVPKS